jgi:polyhydroxybutyrate depolymerase
MNVDMFCVSRIKRSLLPLFVVLISTACTAAQQPTAHNSVSNVLTVGGAEREYLVYKPALAASKKLPLMIVLHGGLSNAGAMENTTGMDDLADSGQFVVAYPNGTGGRFALMKDKRTWNAGVCCGVAQKDNVDDVKFISMMIDEIEKQYAIDSTRIYVVGHSNGAMMAYRLACEIPGKIAAMVSVSGTLAADTCEGANSVAILEIHGDRDENVPIGGGKGSGPSGVAYRSTADSLDMMMKTRQCRAPTQTNSGGIEKTIYSCSHGAPVQLIVNVRGTHPWPGGHGRNSNDANGFSATNAAWQFVNNFSKAPLS